MSSSIWKVIFPLLFIVKLSSSEKCLISDMMYKYTECDANGQRWRVSVPNTTKSCDIGSEFPKPIRARNCKNPCNAGTYLDIVTQECKDCLPGTFSQSSDIEIDNWSDMPPGFITNSFGIDVNCDTEKWEPRGFFLATTVKECESHLIYTASLFDKGVLTFEYQHPDDDIIFGIKVSNDNCQSTKTTEKNLDFIKYLNPTGPSKWKKVKFDLAKGRNTIQWSVVSGESNRNTVKIKYLKITKSIFLFECMKCAAGYFSSGRSTKCTPCPMNKFNKNRGSAQCDDCPDDNYSFPGSNSCNEKKPCREADYGYKWTECDKENQRKKIFYWISPKLCSDKKPESITLPNESTMVQCPPCPDGTYNSSTNTCEYCTLGTALDSSTGKCNKCPPNTKPIYEINYDKWARPLPNLSFRCLSIDNSVNDCISNETWIYNGDNLQTSPAVEMNLLQLDFQTKNDTEKISSEFSFDFEINCTSYCALHLFLKKSKTSTKLINRWTNSTKRHIYTYDIPRENSGRIIWFFSRSRDYSIDQKTIDYLKIYSIKTTQVNKVGAVRCQFCNPDFPSTECADCGKGKFFSLETRKCTTCHFGQILETNPSSNNYSCVNCGAGLIAVNGSVCLPNISFVSTNGNKYNFAQLKVSQIVLGKSLFTTHGQPYQHLFNVTLFSNSDSMSICKNNATSIYDYMDESGPLCRLTLVSTKLPNATVYAMQPIRIADKFVEIQQSNSSNSYWKKMNDSLINQGFPGDIYGMDLHFSLKSERKTDNCKDGYKTTVTLRCDTSSTRNELLLPPKCAMETCDGCSFHILFTSKSACPECRLEDYTIITEECFNGNQKQHFQIPKYCVPPEHFRDKVNIKCPLFTTKMEIGIIVTASILCFLLGLVIYCHKKNKKLEYKYSRLISGNDDNENVLNGAESCGMNDDEDDEDDVKIKTNSKSGKIFAKYNRPSQYRNDKNSMERINLNENPDFDI